MILSIIQSETTTAFNFSRLKNKRFIEAEEVAIETMFN